MSDLEQMVSPAEEAMTLAKDLIRSKNKLQIAFNPHEDDFVIGYGRDLGRDPLDAEELYELIKNGFTYPFNGNIRASFAEYLLHKETVDATGVAMHLFGSDTFFHLSTKRQQFLIHLTRDINLKHLSKMKSFIKHVKEMDWQLATSQLLSYQSPMGRMALVEG